MGRRRHAPRSTARSRVRRAALMTEIRAELESSGVVLLGATGGMGKSSLLRDLAREVRADDPERPVVTIDLQSAEIRAFRDGKKAALEEWLTAVAKTSYAMKRQSAAGASDPEERKEAGVDEQNDRSPRPRRVRCPSRCVGPTARLVWACLAAVAPVWARSYASGLALAVDMGSRAPVVLIDNYARGEGDEEEVDNFSMAVRDWRRAGARFVIASGPLDCPSPQFPEALRIGGRLLRVGRSEMSAWAGALMLPADTDLMGQTRGVPVLIDAVRSAADPSSLADDPRYVATVARLLGQNLAEPLSPEANRARVAMTLLGSGNVSDLAEVGVHVKSDDLVFLADEFPVFGLDASSGTFATLAAGSLVSRPDTLQLVRMYPHLAMRCMDVLVSRGDNVRAAALLCLLSETDAVRALARNPGAYADAACDGLIGRCLRSPGATIGLDEATAAGLALIGELYARAHGKDPGRAVRAGVEYAPENLRPCIEAIAALNAVESAPGAVARACREGLRADDPAGRRLSSPACWADLCASMLGNALSGQVPGFVGDWDEMEKAVDFEGGGLAASVLAFFATVCACACGQAGRALSWVVPLAAHARATRPTGPGPATVSDALLSAARAFAGLLCERPSAVAACDGAVEEIGAARAFFETRGLRPASVAMGFFEAVALALGGRELEAEPLFEVSLAHWTSHGDTVGQALCSLGVAYTELVRGAPSQARVFAHTAHELSSKLRMGPAVAFAHMVDAVAECRGEGLLAVDARMLEASMRRSALLPRTSAFLEAEMAALHVWHAEPGRAADILQSPLLFDSSYRCRIVCLCARCMGPLAKEFVDLMPRDLKKQYASLRRELMASAALDARPALEALYGSRKRKAVRVEVFGGLRVKKNGHLVSENEWGRRISRDLLELLATHPKRPFTRIELLGILWEDHPGTANRNNLSSALSTLRRILGQVPGGPEYVLAKGDMVSLNLELVETDAVDFEDAARFALTKGADQSVADQIEACRIVQAIYGQGMRPCDGPVAKVLNDRSREFALTFVDCMVTGARRALEADNAAAALFFARAAKREAPDDADVEAVLEQSVEAVRSLGSELDSFAQQMLDPFAISALPEPVAV